MPIIDPASSAFRALEGLVTDFQSSGAREIHLRVGVWEVLLSVDACEASLDGSDPSSVAERARRASAVVQTAGSQAPPPELAAVAIPSGAVIVSASNLGTFYRSPKPGAAPYVEVGSIVAEGSELCLIEVMKLFTAVRSNARGRVAAILIADGEMVAAGQPLFAIQPEPGS